MPQIAITSKAVAPLVKNSDLLNLSTGNSMTGSEAEQKFEASILRVLIGMMVPDIKGTFGSGSAGRYWKSLLLDGISDEVAKSRKIPIIPMKISI